MNGYVVARAAYSPVMAASDDHPIHYELENVMQRAGVPPMKQQKVVKAASLSRRRYNRFLHQYKLNGVDGRSRDGRCFLPPPHCQSDIYL